MDDNELGADQWWLDETHTTFEEKWGPVKRTRIPYEHTGVRRTRTELGLRLDEDEFCQSAKQVPIEAHRVNRDDSQLKPKELTAFRGLSGVLLWLCQTRLDAVADVVLLQTHVSHATIMNLKQANSLLARVQKYSANCGPFFMPLRPPLVVKSVHDACGSTKLTAYRQEGILTLLAEDRDIPTFPKSPEVPPEFYHLVGGAGHVMTSLANKSKRISYSASHGETNAMCRAKQFAQLVSLRFAEVLQAGICLPLRSRCTLGQLIVVQEQNLMPFPCDQYTDCGGLWELVTGVKGVPQDKSQRLYIMSIREDRVNGRIRRFFLIPTNIMFADSLTKHMICKIFMDFCCSGIWRTSLADKKIKVRGRIRLNDDLTEDDLVNLQEMD